jgi:7-cyano-7-deazaguanine synthase
MVPEPEWWPFRNQLLITFAASWAVQAGANQVIYGAVSDDSAFRDSSGEFVRLLNDTVSYQEGAIRVDAPAIGLTTLDLTLRSGIPRDLLARTHSCDVSNFYCGECPSCLTRRRLLNSLDAPVTEPRRSRQALS